MANALQETRTTAGSNGNPGGVSGATARLRLAPLHDGERREVLVAPVVISHVPVVRSRKHRAHEGAGGEDNSSSLHGVSIRVVY